MNAERKIQECVFLPGLNSNMILKGQEVLPGFIIDGCNINSIHKADDTVLMTNSEEKLKEL